MVNDDREGTQAQPATRLEDAQSIIAGKMPAYPALKFGIPAEHYKAFSTQV